MKWGGVVLTIVVLVVVMFGVVYFTGQTDGQVNTQFSVLSKQEASKNICKAYTQNYPTSFFVEEQQCSMKSGDYVCRNNNVGCYDMGGWDYVAICESDEAQALEGLCGALEGNWICTTNEISCEV